MAILFQASPPLNQDSMVILSLLSTHVSLLTITVCQCFYQPSHLSIHSVSPSVCPPVLCLYPALSWIHYIITINLASWNDQLQYSGIAVVRSSAQR